MKTILALIVALLTVLTALGATLVLQHNERTQVKGKTSPLPADPTRWHHRISYMERHGFSHIAAVRQNNNPDDLALIDFRCGHGQGWQTTTMSISAGGEINKAPISTYGMVQIDENAPIIIKGNTGRLGTPRANSTIYTGYFTNELIKQMRDGSRIRLETHEYTKGEKHVAEFTLDGFEKAFTTMEFLCAKPRQDRKTSAEEKTT